MDKVRHYRDLIVWQKAMDLTTLVYQQTSSYPKEEIYGLTSQLRRASVSVPSNIAEGQARNTTGEFVQALGTAKGSLAEIETQIILSERLKFIQTADSSKVLQDCSEISKLLHGLIKSLTNHS